MSCLRELTNRQKRIFCEHANGYTFKEIASMMGISYPLVRQEVREVKDLLTANTAAQIVGILLIDRQIGFTNSRFFHPTKRAEIASPV